MNYKKLVIIFLLLILTMGAVSAQEDLIANDGLAMDDNRGGAVEAPVNDEAALGAGATHEITEDNYNDYFYNDTGELKEDVLNDGDTIKLGNLTNKLFRIDKSLTVTSISSNDTLSNCMIDLKKGADNSVIDGVSVVTNVSQLTSIQKQWTITGFDPDTGDFIYGWADVTVRTNLYPLVLEFVNNVTVSNSYFKANPNQQQSMGRAMILSYANNCTFVNNIIGSDTGSVKGIMIAGSSYNNFTGNIVYTTSSQSFYFANPGTAVTTPARDGSVVSCGNIIENNIISAGKMGGSLGDGIQVYAYIAWDVLDTVINDNTFVNVSRGFHNQNWWNGQTVSGINITNNKFINVTSRAISFSASNLYISGNEINSSSVGIFIDGPNACVINNNISAKSIAIDVSGKAANYNNIHGVNATVTGNNIIGTGSSEAISVSISNATIKNNNVYANNSYAIVVTGQNNTVSDNYLIANATFGDVSVSAVDNNIVENNNPSEGSILIETADYVYGGDNIIFVNVVPAVPNGNLTITVSGKNYNNVTVYDLSTIVDDVLQTLSIPFNVSCLNAGDYAINVTYNGNYPTLTNESNFTVGKVKTDLTINVADTVIIGQSADVNIAITDGADGKLIVKVNGKYYDIIDISDVYSIVESAGNYNVEVIFEGDDNYGAASDSASFKVIKKDSNITGSADSTIKQTTVVVNTPSDANGYVVLTVGGKNYYAVVDGGKATFVLGDLKSGSNYVAAVSYSGDGNYNNDSIDVDINTPDLNNPDIKATFNNNTLSTSLDKGAAGYVLVDVGGKNYYAAVKDGKVSFDLSDLESGDYNATVTYTGDDNYASSSTDIKVKVSKKDANINAADVTVDEGQKAVLTVKLADDATGIILAEIDGVTYGALIRNGAATITVPGLAAGNYTANIAYNGDKSYNSEDSSAKITVNAVEPSVVISAPDVEKFYSGSERFAVKITEDGKAANNKTVQLTINGNTYTRTTDANGETSLPLNLNSGKYNVNVKVDDITQNALITIKETVNANDITKIYRNATQYSATFYDNTGKVLANTMVRFNINGIYYNRTTDANGVAGLNINLNPDKYVLTAINPSTGEQKTSIVTVLPPIVDNHDIVKKYRNATQYTAKVLKNDGSIAGAGEIVRFNINGIYYDRTTDANGIVQLNINLQPGEYIITAEYNGYMTSNKVTVLSA